MLTLYSYPELYGVADNNGYPPGRGTIDWRAYITALREVGYDGYLSAEFVVPIDRTPAALAEQEVEEVAATGSTHRVVLSERYYDQLVQ